MAEKFLKDKKVLFIGYEHYDYHMHICKALRQAGVELEYYSLMNKHIFYLLCRQISFKLFLAYNEHNAVKILKSIKNSRFDYVFVTAGYQLPIWFYYELKKLNKGAVFINYTWDSVCETEHRNTILDILPIFDICYSFDRTDCEKYGIQRYLPLFYIDEYANLVDNKKNPNIDILFIGTLFTDIRYHAVKEIEKVCKIYSLNFYYYLCVSYRFFLRRFFKYNMMTRNIYFKSIKHRDIIKLYSSSKAIIDLAGNIQSGLTMRTFEVLGSGKKLITTNANVKHEDFYDPDYISVIDLENPEIDVDFVNKKTTKIIDMSKYSIHSWLKNLFVI